MLDATLSAKLPLTLLTLLQSFLLEVSNTMFLAKTNAERKRLVANINFFMRDSNLNLLLFNKISNHLIKLIYKFVYSE